MSYCDLYSLPDPRVVATDKSEYPSPSPFSRTSPYYHLTRQHPPSPAVDAQIITPLRLTNDLADPANGYPSFESTFPSSWCSNSNDSDVALTYSEMSPSVPPEPAGRRPETFPIPREMRSASGSSQRSMNSIEAEHLGWSRAIYAPDEGESEGQKALQATEEETRRSTFPSPLTSYFPDFSARLADPFRLAYDAVPFTSTTPSSFPAYDYLQLPQVPIPGWVDSDHAGSLDELCNAWFDFQRFARDQEALGIFSEDDEAKGKELQTPIQVYDQPAGPAPKQVHTPPATANAAAGPSKTSGSTPPAFHYSDHLAYPQPGSSASHAAGGMYHFSTPMAAGPAPSLMPDTGSTAHSNFPATPPSGVFLSAQDHQHGTGSGRQHAVNYQQPGTYHLPLPPAFASDAFVREKTTLHRSTTAGAMLSVGVNSSPTSGVAWHAPHEPVDLRGHTGFAEAHMSQEELFSPTPSPVSLLRGSIVHNTAFLPSAFRPAASHPSSSLEVTVDDETSSSRRACLPPLDFGLSGTHDLPAFQSAFETIADSLLHPGTAWFHDRTSQANVGMSSAKRPAPFMRRNLDPAAPLRPGQTLIFPADEPSEYGLQAKQIEEMQERSGKSATSIAALPTSVESKKQTSKTSAEKGKGKAQAAQKKGKAKAVLQPPASPFRDASPPSLFDAAAVDFYGSGMNVDDKRGILERRSDNRPSSPRANCQVEPKTSPIRNMTFVSPDSTPTRQYKRAHEQQVIDIRAIENARARSSSFAYPDLEDLPGSDTDTDERPLTKKPKRKKTLAQRMMSLIDGDDDATRASNGGGKRHPVTGELYVAKKGEGALTQSQLLGRKGSSFRPPTPIRASVSAGSFTGEIRPTKNNQDNTVIRPVSPISGSASGSAFHKGPAEGLRRKRAFVPPSPVSSCTRAVGIAGQTRLKRSMTGRPQVSLKPFGSDKHGSLPPPIHLPFTASSVTAPVPRQLDRTDTDLTLSTDPYTDRDAEGEDEFPDEAELEQQEAVREGTKAGGDGPKVKGASTRTRAATAAPAFSTKAGKAPKKSTAAEMVAAGEGSSLAYTGRGYTEEELRIMIPHWDGQSALSNDALTAAQQELIANGYKYRETTALKWYMKNTLHSRILDYAKQHPAANPLPPSRRTKS